MKTIMFYIIFTLLTGTTLKAQTKVEGFSFGKYGTDKYEHFEFWTKDSKRSDIVYAFGKNVRQINLKYSGKEKLKGMPGFKVQFPNKYILYIIPGKLYLKVTDDTGIYSKTFSWEYEVPVNGIGTFCEMCAQDNDDAMKIIQPFISSVLPAVNQYQNYADEILIQTDY